MKERIREIKKEVAVLGFLVITSLLVILTKCAPAIRTPPSAEIAYSHLGGVQTPGQVFEAEISSPQTALGWRTVVNQTPDFQPDTLEPQDTKVPDVQNVPGYVLTLVVNAIMQALGLALTPATALVLLRWLGTVVPALKPFWDLVSQFIGHRTENYRLARTDLIVMSEGKRYENIATRKLEALRSRDHDPAQVLELDNTLKAERNSRVAHALVSRQIARDPAHASELIEASVKRFDTMGVNP